MREEAKAIYSLRIAQSRYLVKRVRLDVNVRLADLEDMNALMMIEEDCFGSERFPTEVVRAFLERDDAFVVLAEEEEVLGSAMGMVSEEMGEGKIASIAVLRRARGRGVGSALLEECENWFSAHELKKYTLEVEVGNEPAMSLYASRGYAVTGFVVDLYGAGRNGYAMEKRIDSGGKKVPIRDA